jgi:hypothetical protein
MLQGEEQVGAAEAAPLHLRAVARFEQHQVAQTGPGGVGPAPGLGGGVGERGGGAIQGDDHLVGADRTGPGAVDQAKPLGGDTGEMELGSAMADHQLAMVACAENGEIVGDLDGASLDEPRSCGGFTSTGTAGDRDQSVAPAEGVGVEHQVTPVAMESGQHGMGEHELRTGGIKVDGGLNVNGVRCFDKKRTDPRTGIQKKCPGQGARSRSSAGKRRCVRRRQSAGRHDNGAKKINRQVRCRVTNLANRHFPRWFHRRCFHHPPA